MTLLVSLIIFCVVTYRLTPCFIEFMEGSACLISISRIFPTNFIFVYSGGNTSTIFTLFYTSCHSFFFSHWILCG